VKNWLRKVVEFAESHPQIEIVSIQSRARTFRIRFVDDRETPTQEELAMLKIGHKIDAIKSVRDRTNKSLMESKAFIERYIAKHPEAYVVAP
jgi:ribosomal protein L7/L12